MIDFAYWLGAYLTESGGEWVASVKSLILRVILTLVILIILLWIAVFFYGSFYYLYMPTISYRKPVYFQFRPALSESCAAVADKRDTADYMCSFPTANLSLHQVMVRGQTYRVSLELDMPDSPINQEIGMFLVKIDFYSKNGEITKTSERPTMMRYRSLVLHALETIMFIPLFLTGAAEEKQLMAVELFSDYVEDAYKPSVGVLLEIQSFKIQLYSAVLKIHAEFTGLRYVMYHWPMMCAFIGISSNMFFLLTIAFFSWFRFLWAKTEGPTLERMDSRRVLFDQPLPEEERRRNLQEMLEKEEQEEAARRSSQSSNSSSTPETLQPQTRPRRSSEETNKSSTDEDTVVVTRRDLEKESESMLRLRQSSAT